MAAYILISDVINALVSVYVHSPLFVVRKLSGLFNVASKTTYPTALCLDTITISVEPFTPFVCDVCEPIIVQPLSVQEEQSIITAEEAILTPKGWDCIEAGLEVQSEECVTIAANKPVRSSVRKPRQVTVKTTSTEVIRIVPGITFTIDDLGTAKVNTLRSWCKACGLSGYMRMVKAQLVDELTTYLRRAS